MDTVFLLFPLVIFALIISKIIPAFIIFNLISFVLKQCTKKSWREIYYQSYFLTSNLLILTNVILLVCISMTNWDTYEYVIYPMVIFSLVGEVFIYCHLVSRCKRMYNKETFCKKHLN